MKKTIKYGEEQSNLMRELINRFDKKDVPHIEDGCVEKMVPQNDSILGLFKHIHLDPEYNLYAFTSFCNDYTHLFTLAKTESVQKYLGDFKWGFVYGKKFDMDIASLVRVPFTAEALWEAFLLWDSRSIFLTRLWHANYGKLLLLTDKKDFDREFTKQSFRSSCKGDLDSLNFDFSPTITMDEDAKTAEITFYHWSPWSRGCMKSGAKIKWHDYRVEITCSKYPNPDYKGESKDDQGWDESPELDYEYVDLGIPFEPATVLF